eukprot:TRINITY_DN9752_c0_g1_i1.p1 TRINITY_DN9752_c0_g1~~TRINITY_DN9752_c0_g1_i1.p1  ORF type:complete len:648 (-),score=152.84 TRINITY_DN9752_c0_g1_i1:107-2050(-)
MDKDAIINEVANRFDPQYLNVQMISHVVDQFGDLNSVIEVLSGMGYPQVQINETDEERELRDLNSMFSDLMTQSVIQVVYRKNDGNLQDTVDHLISIQCDNDAMATIRAMSDEEKRIHEERLIAEKEERDRLRREQIEFEINEEKLRVAELERQKKEMEELRNLEEERIRERERLALIQAEEMQRKLEELEYERYRLQEENRLEEERLKELEILEEQRLMNEQRIIEENRRIDEEKRLETHKRLQEEDTQHREREILERTVAINNATKLMTRLIEETSKCTIVVQYSQEEISASWKLSDQYRSTVADWFGLFRSKEYRSHKHLFKYESAGRIEGNFIVEAPKYPGVYEIRYHDSANNVVSTSEPIIIGPRLDLTAQVSSDGNYINVIWEVEQGKIDKWDWIGLFSANDKNCKNYIESNYLEEGNHYVNFKMPREPGEYEIRYVPYLCGNSHVSVSNIVCIDDTNALNWEPIRGEKNRLVTLKVSCDITSVQQHHNDYVGLYLINSPNGSYISYQYVNLKEPYLNFDAPYEIGTYNFRYHSYTTGLVASVSQPFTVPNTDEVIASVDCGIISVYYDIHSVLSNSYDWIGIFKVGETNNKNYTTYKYIDRNSHILVFDMPRSSGQYEARYFSYSIGRYESFRKSDPISC